MLPSGSFLSHLVCGLVLHCAGVAGTPYTTYRACGGSLSESATGLWVHRLRLVCVCVCCVVLGVFARVLVWHHHTCAVVYN